MDYSEKELINRCKTGDTGAFEELISSYEKRIFNIAYNMLGNREDAFDAAQDACIKIYKSIYGFKENSALSTWIYRIVSNVCIDFLRKRNKVLPLYISKDEKELEIPLVDKEKTPDEILESKEESTLIRVCIKSLPPDSKIIIILRDIYGYSYDEISSILNISMGTVKSRLSRARNLLKDKIRAMELFKDRNV